MNRLSPFRFRKLRTTECSRVVEYGTRLGYSEYVMQFRSYDVPPSHYPASLMQPIDKK